MVIFLIIILSVESIDVSDLILRWTAQWMLESEKTIEKLKVTHFMDQCSCPWFLPMAGHTCL